MTCLNPFFIQSFLLNSFFPLFLTVTFICFLATFRSTGGIMALFFSLTLTFFLLALGHFFLLEVGAKGPNGLVKAGGVFGVITALIAWYNALAGLLTPE